MKKKHTLNLDYVQKQLQSTQKQKNIVAWSLAWIE